MSNGGAVLVELEQPYTSDLTPEQRSILEQSSVSAVGFSDDGKRLDYSSYPIVTADMLRHFPGWTVRRAIENESTRKLSEFGQRHTVVTNERCHVAVAGLGLLTIDEVEAHEDLCTDVLAGKLKEGWRILAVCVQPDQRRPDYVLGRSSGVRQ